MTTATMGVWKMTSIPLSEVVAAIKERRAFKEGFEIGFKIGLEEGFKIGFKEGLEICFKEGFFEEGSEDIMGKLMEALTEMRIDTDQLARKLGISMDNMLSAAISRYSEREGLRKVIASEFNWI